MKKLLPIIAVLVSSALACRAESGSPESWSHLAIQVPPGYRLAVTALLPGARVVERSRLAALAGDSAAPDLLASFEPPGGDGYVERGAWLSDRVHLARRIDPELDAEGGESSAIRDWSAREGFDEGSPRFAVFPRIQELLGESHPLLVEFDRHGRRLLGEATIDDLLQGRIEAAFLDGASAAELHRREHPSRDLLAVIVLEEGRRELRLYATRNRMDLAAAIEILMEGRAALRGLGYVAP